MESESDVGRGNAVANRFFPRRAFTVIELIVVVAVLLVLAALLLPSLKGAKERGKQAFCINNLRQLFTAFVAYAADHDGTIPQVGTPYASLYGTRGASWHHWLGKAGYLGSRDNTPNRNYYVGPVAGLDNTRWRILHCPSEPGAPLVDLNYPKIKGTKYYDSEFNVTSYVLNWSVSRYWYYGGGNLYYCNCGSGGIWSPPNVPACCDPYPFRKAWFKGPENGRRADAPLVMDCPVLGLWDLPFFNSHVDDIVGAYAFEVYSYYAFRHVGERANVLYMDGHVESVQHKRITGKPVYRELWSYDPP